MTKGEIIQTYRELSIEDQKGFDSWLKANAVIASLFAAALLGMAIGGSDVSVSTQALAKDAQTTGYGATQRIERIDVVSPYDLTLRYAPDQLPVEQVDAPF